MLATTEELALLLPFVAGEREAVAAAGAGGGAQAERLLPLLELQGRIATRSTGSCWQNSCSARSKEHWR
jgi:hypothetical protein